MKIVNVSLLKFETRNVIKVELTGDSAKVVHIDLEGQKMKNDFYVFYEKKGERYDSMRINKSVKWGRFLQSVKAYIKVNNIDLFKNEEEKEENKEVKELKEIINIKRNILKNISKDKGSLFTLKKELLIMQDEINSLLKRVSEIEKSEKNKTQECINKTDISLKEKDKEVIHRLYREDGRIVCELKDGYIFGLEECGIVFADTVMTLRYYLKHEVEKIGE